MRHRALTVFLMGALALGVSSESRAALEWLHKLSGPGPFLGPRASVRLDCTGAGPVGAPGLANNSDAVVAGGSRKALRRCRLLELGAGAGRTKFDADLWSWPQWTVSLSGAWARSTDNDLEYDGGERPSVEIWSIEPAVQVWLTEKNKVFVGFGYSFNAFNGERFEDFWRNAMVIRLGLRKDCRSTSLRAFEAGVKYLIFEDRFRPSDFGARGDDLEERGVIGLFAMVYF